MPYAEKRNDLHGRPMVNVVSSATFYIYIYDQKSSTPSKSPGWLSLKIMEDEIKSSCGQHRQQVLHSKRESMQQQDDGLLVRRHIVVGEFHYIGKEASTRWASGPDLSVMTEAGALEPTDETFREYERVVDPRYLDQIRVKAKEFSLSVSPQSGLAECAIRNFKNGENTIRPRSFRKLIRAIHDLHNKNVRE